MYVPRAFTLADAQVAAAIDAAPFATLVTADGDGMPLASHIPVLRDGDALVGHVARANPHAALLAAGRVTTVIFHGPHAYVSPTWYASGPAVPTWNYIAVHAIGHPVAITDEIAVRATLDALSRTFETGERPWRLADQADTFIAGLVRGIIAFRLVPDRVDAKAKLSQNRPPADRAGVIAALLHSTLPGDRDLAAAMRDFAE